MNYFHLSPNVIGCEDFLPPYALDEIKIELLNNRSAFQIPKWETAGALTVESYSWKCGAEDYWIDSGTDSPPNKKILNLSSWFLHQGIINFIKDKTSVFDLLERRFKSDVHVLSYNHGGYYNWHCDRKEGNLFTFSLILNEGDQLKGGDLLLRDGGKTITVANKNNLMIVLPSYIAHAVTPLYSEDKKDVPFAAQRFSIQHWLSLW